MNDTVLLFTGISVFCLMLVAIVFTVMEFQELGKQNRRVNAENRRKGDSGDSD